ncbi:MAG: hypothetical protein QW812_06270, partial [Thermoplasmataceae archaeon]
VLLETQTPTPLMRIRALGKFAQEGIRTWIYFGPIIRGFNDDENVIEGIAEMASETGSRVIYDFYNPYPSSSKMINASGLKIESGTSEWKAKTQKKLEEIMDRHGIVFNSQSEDFVAEARLLNRNLEDFNK